MEQQPRTREEIENDLSQVRALVEAKRNGRRAMVERGMEVGPEEEDPDMQDLLAREKDLLAEIAALNAQEQEKRENDARQTEIRDL